MKELHKTIVGGLAVTSTTPDPRAPDRAAVPVVCLVHGAMDSARSLRRVMRRLAEAVGPVDFDVVAIDRRGYGESIDLMPASAVADHCADIWTVIGDRPTTIVGHSYGGVVALACGIERPTQVRSIVAYEAPRPWREWWPRNSAGSKAVSGAGGSPELAAEMFLRAIISDATWERLTPKMQDRRRAEGPALVSDLTSMRVRAYADDELTQPVTAAHGSESHGRHVRTAQELASMTLLGELAVIEGAAHGAHRSHAEAFAELCLGSLQRADFGV